MRPVGQVELVSGDGKSIWPGEAGISDGLVVGAVQVGAAHTGSTRPAAVLRPVQVPDRKDIRDWSLIKGKGRGVQNRK